MARLKDTNTVNARRAVLAALLRAHATGGRKKPVRAVAAFIGKRVSGADVLTIAAGNATKIAVTGQTLGLTDAGLIEAREHPQPRYLAA